MKRARQNIILEIIAAKDIETQNQLMQALSELGVKSTQATLSRDIKELRLVKELSPSGRYRYAPPVTMRNCARYLKRASCPATRP